MTAMTRIYGTTTRSTAPRCVAYQIPDCFAGHLRGSYRFARQDLGLPPVAARLYTLGRLAAVGVLGAANVTYPTPKARP